MGREEFLINCITMPIITKIKLHNFKRFRDLTIDVNPDLNIFIGDNESGKSTLLQAIDLVSRGSVTRVGNIGLDKLFNVSALTEFMAGARDVYELPTMYVELYFENECDEDLEGKNNSLGLPNCSGIRMRCYLNDKYTQVVSQLLSEPNASFPLEFYHVEFDTFSGSPFNAYTKKLHSLYIDNSTIGSSYSMREYVSDIFHSQLTDLQRVNARHAYKDSKLQFQADFLAQYNERIAPYSFAIRESADDNIETDITLLDCNIPLENKGTGTQCFIKTKLSMNRANTGIDTVLIEEPENHLSYMKMLELINVIRESHNKQIFISTHSDLIATRLNLKNCFLVNSASANVISLKDLSEDTAAFFVKAPDNNMLQFVLSNKSILVEGDAEFILMESLYKRTVDKELYASGIGVISVDGKCFKRYLEIAALIQNKVAVITDNDGDYAENITNNYSEYTQDQYPNIRIFSDTDNTRWTFEVCLYEENKVTCEAEFNTPKRRLTILDYMLKNKTESAFMLYKNRSEVLNVPHYIQEAVRWIDD